MPSINNSFSLDKTPVHKDAASLPAAKEAVTEAKKPFSKHLQDEIEKEVEEPVASDLPKQKDSDTDDLPKYAVLTAVNIETVEDNNNLLSGNSLPIVETLTDPQVDGEQLAAKSLVLGEDAPRMSLPKTLSSVSVQLSDEHFDSNTPELDITIDDQVKVFDELDADIVKVQKLVVDGQANVKTELIVNDGSKSLKIVQAVPINTVNAADTSRASLDSLPTQSHITTPVNHKQWGAELTQRISVMVNNGQQQVAEMRLNPAHLGSISVRLQLDEDQANISFITHHQAVKEAIEISLPRLRDQLQQQGLDLGHVDIENRGQEETSSDSGFSRSSREFSEETEETATGLIDVTATINSNSGVSVFV